MNFEFMTIGTQLPPCMPFPRALTGFPVSSTAKVMYCRMLDAMLSNCQEDENGILFICFPVTAIAAVLSRSPMSVKRSLNELETAGLIMRVRQGPLPPCMPFPRALTGFPVSSTAKVMYCRMLDAMLSNGQEDETGILFVCFPVTAIAAVLSRSPMTVKRSLNELETAGLFMRVRQGVGEPNHSHCRSPVPQPHDGQAFFE